MNVVKVRVTSYSYGYGVKVLFVAFPLHKL